MHKRAPKGYRVVGDLRHKLTGHTHYSVWQGDRLVASWLSNPVEGRYIAHADKQWKEGQRCGA